MNVVQGIVHINVHLHWSADHTAQKLGNVGGVVRLAERHHRFCTRAIPTSGEVLFEKDYLNVAIIRNAGRLHIRDIKTGNLQGGTGLTKCVDDFASRESNASPLGNLQQAIIKVCFGNGIT